jgi:hypothetical protein
MPDRSASRRSRRKGRRELVDRNVLHLTRGDMPFALVLRRVKELPG